MLASAGRPLFDDDLVTYLLTGLDNSYDLLVTSVTTHAWDVTVDNLFAHMLDFEIHQERSGGGYNISTNTRVVAMVETAASTTAMTAAAAVATPTGAVADSRPPQPRQEAAAVTQHQQRQ